MTTMDYNSPIKVSEIECGYPTTPVLRQVDLTVDAGRIHAIVGLNGAGKTTLMRAVLGMLEPDSGYVEVFGNRADTAPAGMWADVGYLLGAPFSYGELTGRQNIYAAARLHGLNRSQARQATDAIIEELRITSEAGKRARKLSSGNRQRVALAAAFVHRPTLLVLDEPATALDPLAVVRLRRVLRHMAQDRGTTILVSSHHLDEVARMADDVTVIHRGRVIASLDPRGSDLEQRFFDLVYEAELGESS